MNIDDLVSGYQVTLKKMQDAMQAGMKDMFKEFFKQNPKVTKMSWYQYTPYFNDGDECVFNAHIEDMGYLIQGMIEDNNDPYEWLGQYSKLSEYDTGDMTNEEKLVLHGNFIKFHRELKKIPDEIFKATFGDHCQVTVTPKGFDVEEYEHE